MKRTPRPSQVPAKAKPAPPAPPSYEKALIEKRDEARSNLGMKFDTIASMGRVAEEDQAQLSHDEFITLRLNNIDYQKLRMVEEALDRLSRGDYGVCDRCEEPIPEKRLRAIPWAKYCVSCQEQISRQEMDEYRPSACA
jgi:DnaK suppressor protein